MNTLSGHSQAVRDVKADFANQVAVSCSDDSTLRVWDLSNGRCRKKLEGHLDRVSVLCARFDKHKVISGSDDYSIRLWDLEDMVCEHSFFAHSGLVKKTT